MEPCGCVEYIWQQNNAPQKIAQTVKNLPAMQETKASILGWGRSPGEEHGNPFQYSFLENSHGQKSLVGYSPWGLKELDTTE